MEGYIAEIRLFAGNFAPQNWAYCQGQVLMISQFTALYSIIGITYGGNGSTNFALPDLRGRVAVGAGTGPGLTPRILGYPGGAESCTLTTAQMPMHNHMLGCHNGGADESSPMGNVLSTESGMGVQIYSNAGVNDTMHPASISSAGSSQPLSLMQPYQALNYIICLNGIYPVRD